MWWWWWKKKLRMERKVDEKVNLTVFKIYGVNF